jgi:hypothetical protein
MKKRYWLLLFVVVILFLTWFFWPRIGSHVTAGGHWTWNSLDELRHGPPPPRDMSHHEYRSVPLRITFIPLSTIDDHGNMVSQYVWGGPWGIPRVSPNVSGSVVANGTRVHDSTLSMRVCPNRVYSCAFVWDLTDGVEFADNSDQLTVTLNEQRMGVISHGPDPIANVARRLDRDGLAAVAVPRGPDDPYSHIHVRGGQLFIEQTGPVILPPPVAVASAP